MNKLTSMWKNIAEQLVTAEQDPGFLDDIYDKFGEVFDLKDVTEYKSCSNTDPYFSPSQFTFLSLAIRRALVEGYLLCKAEQRSDQIQLLFNCYKNEDESDEQNTTKSRNNSVCSNPICDTDGQPRTISSKGLWKSSDADQSDDE